MELDRKDLKVKALLEKVSKQEEDIADLRVELTVRQAEHSSEVQRLNTEIEQLRSIVRASSEDEDAEDAPQVQLVVPGEVTDVSEAN